MIKTNLCGVASPGPLLPHNAEHSPCAKDHTALHRALLYAPHSALGCPPPDTHTHISLSPTHLRSLHMFSSLSPVQCYVVRF